MDSNFTDTSKGNKGKGNNHNSSSLLAVSPLVSSSTADVDSSTNYAKISENISNLRDTISQSQMENSRMQHLRTRYQEKGFSEETINLFLSALDQNSSKTMSLNLRAWISWCTIHDLDPITCPISDICDFLADMLLHAAPNLTAA